MSARRLIDIGDNWSVRVNRDRVEVAADDGCAGSASLTVAEVGRLIQALTDAATAAEAAT